MKLPAVLGFTALTFLSWGVYGVLLHKGQLDMDKAMLKPFVFVGIAYFFIAVLFPGAVLSQKGEKGSWTFMGVVLSFSAGVVGALGALGVILALNFGGKPAYVMPFVFGLAPVVNTLVTASINRTFNDIKFLFIVGLGLVILGALGVLWLKSAIPRETTVAVSEVQTNTFAIILSMIMAAFCWGAYGPVLHIGQMRMGGSRLRPFCCVGLAYFFIAVVIPLILLQMGLDRGSLTWSGGLWSLAAGTAGAVGALGIIYAFNFGGKPIFVMPLVFGFAPIINTVLSLSVDGTLSKISPLFVGALAMTIAGAVMVLLFQPKSKPLALKEKTTPAKPTVQNPVVPPTESGNQTATEQNVAPKSSIEPFENANVSGAASSMDPVSTDGAISPTGSASSNVSPK